MDPCRQRPFCFRDLAPSRCEQAQASQTSSAPDGWLLFDSATGLRRRRSLERHSLLDSLFDSWVLLPTLHVCEDLLLEGLGEAGALHEVDGIGALSIHASQVPGGSLFRFALGGLHMWVLRSRLHLRQVPPRPAAWDSLWYSRLPIILYRRACRSEPRPHRAIHGRGLAA